MEQQELRDWEARCIQEEPPACRAGCPLNVDARAFSQVMAKGDLAGARTILEKSMPLTGITARLCEAPCEQYCLRREWGGPVAIGGLERFCVRIAPIRGKILRLPPRTKRVTVAGSGPSSLTVAYDLARKGYPVTLLHRGPGPGAWLRELPASKLPAQVLEEELGRLRGLGVEFRSVPQLNSALFTSGDAFYAGQDDSLAPDLLAMLKCLDMKTLSLPEPGHFTGGLSPVDYPFRFIADVSQGREAAVSLDRFLQGASLTAGRVELRHGKTDLFTQTRDIAVRQRVESVDPAGYSREEAILEAGRCLDCQCLECVRHCVYLAEFGAYPKTYARRVYNNSAIVKGIHQTNRFINTCSLCRQCETICPHDFSMADLCLEARQLMVREKRMPPSAHWFALEEMRSAGSEGSLVRHAPGKTVSRWLFFPGCQLAGIRPDQSLHLYDRLRELEPETGICLDCCGAPAHWAGRVEEFSGILTRLQEIWSTMGRPTMLMACSTCLQIFREHLPRVETASVWAVLAGQPVSPLPPRSALALSDPCTSRNDKRTRNAVRTLLEAMGQPLAPLTMSGELTECCGFGGLMDSANPALARKVSTARAVQSQADMLTYCAMCRDQLAKTGKPVLHLLDLLFPVCAHPATEPPASISERREGRRRLKADVLAGHSPADISPPNPWQALRLVLSEPVAALLEERRILDDDIQRVLFQAKEQGKYFAHGENGRKVASARLGEVTFWVEYWEENEIFHINRAWSHRMLIGGGGT